MSEGTWCAAHRVRFFGDRCLGCAVPENDEAVVRGYELEGWGPGGHSFSLHLAPDLAARFAEEVRMRRYELRPLTYAEPTPNSVSNSAPPIEEKP